MSELRFENSIPTSTPPDKLLPRHYVMMDCHWFWVLLYVCLGHGWALTRVLHDYSSQEGVPCHSWKSQVRGKIWKLDPNHNSSGQAIAIATPLRDDGLPLVLSAYVCLFGSWVGSDKVATWLFITWRSPLPLLQLSCQRRDFSIWSQPPLLWASYCRATPWWWTAIGSECCCMFVWVMDGLWQGCYMTIHHRKE